MPLFCGFCSVFEPVREGSETASLEVEEAFGGGVVEMV